MQLSNNFSLKEMTASQTADRHGISNNPSEDHMDNLKKLCENVLQKLEITMVKLYQYLADIDHQSCVLRLDQV